MARWIKRPVPQVPTWVWNLPDDHPDVDAWLRSAPVPAALEYLRVTLSTPGPGALDGPA